MKFSIIAAWSAALVAGTLVGDLSGRAESPPVVRDVAGNEHRFDSFHDPVAKAVVYVFLDNNCPDANRYLSTLKRLHDRYNSFQMDRRGKPIRRNADGQWEQYDWPGDPVCFLGIYSRAPFLSIRDIAKHALRNNVPFRVLQDPKQELRTMFKVARYTEVRVWDPEQRRVVYSGPIDDQYQQGAGKAKAQRHLLQDVLDRMVSGKPVEPATELTNSGCPIPDLKDVRYEPVTYYQDIEPIIQRRCQECHRPNSAGPFNLLTLQDVQDNAGIIEELVHDRLMPPFPGDSPLELANDRRLTDEEWHKVISWLRGERKLGDPAKRPPPRVFAKDDGQWRIGTPDFIAKMERPFRCPKDGVIDYVYIPVRIPQEVYDKYGRDGTLYIRAIQVKPGAHPQVVHHIQVHEYHGKIKDANQLSRGPAVHGDIQELNALDLLFMYGPSILGARRLGGYEPGDQDNVRIFDGNTGMALNANIIVELHLTPDGRSDYPVQAEVGFVFTKEKPEKLVETNYYYTKRGNFVIPANLKNHSIQGFFPFQKHILIESIRGHCHYAGTKMRIERVGKGDVTVHDLENRALHLQTRGQTLLEVPSWDFNWQVTYRFKEPMVILNDEAILGTCFWDNTAKNLRRVDGPVKDIVWGQQIFQEMFNVLFLYQELDDDDPLVIEAKRHRAAEPQPK